MTAPAHHGGLRIARWYSQQEPHRASAEAARALIELVAEWDAGTLAITLSAPAGGALRADLHAVGDVPSDWREAVSLSLDGLGRVQRTRGEPRPAPAHRARVVASATTLSVDIIGDVAAAEAVGDRRPRPRDRTLHNVGRVLSAADLLRLLRVQPGVVLRTILAPASAFEEDVLGVALASGWDGSTQDLAILRGTVVRCATLIGAPDPIGACARGLLRRWGTGVRIDRSRVPEALWDGDAQQLVGHAVAESDALTLLRLPAVAGTSTLGLAVEEAPRAVVPLTRRMPKASRPVRLGAARGADGRRADVAIDATDLLRHIGIEGATGAGKSTMLATLALESMRAGVGCLMLDSHGSTVDLVQQRLATGVGVRTIRHADPERAVPMNLLSGSDPSQRARAVEEFTALVQEMFDPRREGIVGPRWRSWFTAVVEACAEEFGDKTTLGLVAIVTDSDQRLIRLARRRAAAGSETGRRLLSQYADLGDKERAELLGWCTSKLQHVLSNAAMQAALGVPDDPIDLAAEMDRGGSLLVDLGTPQLGAESARMLGAHWLLKLWMAIGRRARRDQPYLVIVDEAHLFSFGALPAMLAEGRKFGLGVAVATQSGDRLPPALLDAIDANVASSIVFRTGRRGAARAHERLDGWPAADFMRLPDLRAGAIVSRRGIAHGPFELEVDLYRRWPRRDRVSAGAAPSSERRPLRPCDIDLWLSDARLSSGGVSRGGGKEPREWRTLDASLAADRSTGRRTDVATE